MTILNRKKEKENTIPPTFKSYYERADIKTLKVYDLYGKKIQYIR